MNKLFVRLSLMQFLQFLIWGSWFVTAGTYFMQTLGFSGREVGLIYANNALAATFSPIIVGILADKYFSVERLLAFLHIVGAGLLYTMSIIPDFELFYIINLIYALCYMPTFSLSNSMTFHHVKDAKKEYPRIRVWGTIAWISAGLFIGFLNIESTAIPFKIAAGISLVHGLYCLSLPKTDPVKNNLSFLKGLRSPDMKALFADRGFQAIMLSLALISIPAAYYYSFVNPFLNEAGVSNAAGKMSLGQMTEIVMMLALPWFIAKWRLKYIIGIGLILWGLRYGLFILGIQNDSEALFIVALLIHGIAYVFGMLTAQIYIDIKVPDYLRSTAQGFFSFLTMGIMAWIATYIAGETVSFYTLEDGTHDWTSIWQLPLWFGIGTAMIFMVYFKNTAK